MYLPPKNYLYLLALEINAALFIKSLIVNHVKYGTVFLNLNIYQYKVV